MVTIDSLSGFLHCVKKNLFFFFFFFFKKPQYKGIKPKLLK